MAKSPFDRKKILNDAKRFAIIGVPYSVALKHAWREEKLRILKRKLASGIVEFQLKEAGKELTKVFGTTVPHLVPADKRQHTPAGAPYFQLFDTKLQAWRSINKTTADIEL